MNLNEYNHKIEAKVRSVIQKLGGELWIDTKTGVTCPKCNTEMLTMYPRAAVRGYLPQLLVRCPNCRYEGSMFLLYGIDSVEIIRYIFPGFNRKEAKIILKDLKELLEKQKKMMKGSKLIIGDF